MFICTTSTTGFFICPRKNWLAADRARTFFSTRKSVTAHTAKNLAPIFLYLTGPSIYQFTADETFDIRSSFILLTHSTSMPQKPADNNHSATLPNHTYGPLVRNRTSITRSAISCPIRWTTRGFKFRTFCSKNRRTILAVFLPAKIAGEFLWFPFDFDFPKERAEALKMSFCWQNWFPLNPFPARKKSRMI